MYLCKEWWNFGPRNEIRSWTTACGDSPYHETPFATMRLVPGLGSPLRARPDQMHIFACGYGKDFVASAIIMLCRARFWDGRSVQARLDRAFGNFRAWCRDNRKSTSIKDFSYKTFKCEQTLTFLEQVLQ